MVNKALKRSPKTYEIEWVDDSGAGRHIGSAEGLIRQGIPEHLITKFTQPTSDAITFATGGGKRFGARTIGFHSDRWGTSNTYLLKSCPLVRSQGMNVNDLNRPYIWLPGQKPFYVLDASKLTIKCEESNKMYAHKVVENVPHFKEKVTLTTGLVTALTPEERSQPR